MTDMADVARRRDEADVLKLRLMSTARVSGVDIACAPNHPVEVRGANAMSASAAQTKLLTVFELPATHRYQFARLRPPRSK